MLAEHKEDKQKNAANQLKLETENAKREINKALSAEQLHIKRRLSKKQQELREELFVEVRNKLETFMGSSEYLGWLEEKIREALTIAGEDEVQIYLTLRTPTCWKPLQPDAGPSLPVGNSLHGRCPRGDPGKEYFN
ncbi:MAG: V-type ATP synthase subunit E [Blautia marasmi]